MKKFTMLLVCLVALGISVVNAQNKTITGKVTSADDGSTLPGVSVAVKGTTIGTVTDFDGKYTLSGIPADAEALVFSFVGMITQEVAISGQTSINAVLEPEVIGVDEIVVTGYSTRKKEVSASAVAVVGAEDLKAMVPSTSIDNMLQGKAAGVESTALNGKPGQTASIKIRGAVSLNTVGGDKSQPLYVVDGVFLQEEDMNALNPNDIESLTVLKDAASAALYGSRGANGVVVITTKKGKKGSASINYNARFGFANKIADPYEMMNTEDKIKYEEAATGATISEEDKAIMRKYDHNWQDDILKQSAIQSHALSASGGNDKSTYFMSLGYDKNTGIIEGLDGFKRYSARVNTNSKLNDKINVGSTLSLSATESQEPRDRNNVQNPFRAMYDYNPYEPVYVHDADGNVVKDANGDPVYNRTVFGFPILEALKNNTETEKYTRLIGSLFGEYEVIEGLKYHTKISGITNRYSRESYIMPGSVLDGYVGDPGAPGIKTDNGRDDIEYTWLNQLSYSKSIDVHNFDASVFSEYYEGSWHSYSLSSKGYASKQLSTQDNSAEATAASTTKEGYALFSLAGMVDYDYDGKYLASFSVRRDGASRFGDDKKFGTFSSFSLGWNLANEEFIAGLGLFDKLKLITSYGSLGSWNIPNYASKGYYVFGKYGGQTAALPRTYVSNPELTWEAQKSLNFGVEAAVLNNKINATLDYFRNTRSEFLFSDPLSYEGGGYSQYINAGELLSTGLEFSVNADVIRTSDFRWNIGGNVTFMDYEIKSLKDDKEIIVGSNAILRKGEEPFTFYMTRYAGVDKETGDALYLDKDGKETNVYSSGDKVVLEGKSPLPSSYGGLNTYVTYKGIDLSADFSFKYGNYILNYMASNMLSDGDNYYQNQRKDALEYWTPENKDAELPRLNGNSNQTTDRWLQDGSYIRFRSLALGYSLPNSVLSKVGVEKLRLFASAQNLFTWTKFEGDPEVSVGSGESQLGATQSFIPGQYALYSYPAVRTIMFGLDVRF